MTECVKSRGGENTSTLRARRKERRMKCCIQTLEDSELGEKLYDGSSFTQMFPLALAEKEEGFV